MSSHMDFIKEQLYALTAIPSPSGFTKKATDYLLSELTALGFTPERSRKGNVFVTLGGSGSPLVLAAHVDTLGAMVRSIKENGRLRPTTLGGHQWSTADGENCTIHTRDGKVYTGVVLNTEPSAHVADQKVEQIEKHMEILLDENVDSREGTLALGIQTGDRHGSAHGSHRKRLHQEPFPGRQTLRSDPARTGTCCQKRRTETEPESLFIIYRLRRSRTRWKFRSRRHRRNDFR